MKNIAVILGSINDLKQCQDGLATLAEFVWQHQESAHETDMATLRDHVSQGLTIGGQIKVIVHVRSAHRHTSALQELLTALSKKREPYVIIAAAGKAAILPGFIDAYLRNELKNTTIPVIGVGFTGENDRDTIAATLSITQTPGTQVIFAGEGWQGFNQACVMACEEKNFPAIELAGIPRSETMSLAEARQRIKQLNQKP